MRGARSKTAFFAFLGYPSTVLRTAYRKQFYPKPMVPMESRDSDGVPRTRTRTRIFIILAWSCQRADHGLTRPTSVVPTTIDVCKILSRSVEIWQYKGENLFWSKNRERPSVENKCLASSIPTCRIYDCVHQSMTTRY